MASLDKSLDDIISSSRGKKFIPKKKFDNKKITKKPNQVKPKTFQKLAEKASARANNYLDSSYANKVVVYGLPKDLKQDSIKEFFQSQVGGVASVGCSYNERGQFKGIATIIFSNSKSAAKAVEKYNGAPIDNGSNKLKLELIVDPTKKPLSTRIAANTKPTKSLTQRIKAVGGPKGPGAKGTKGAKGPAAKGKPSGPKPKKAPKKEKKTIEQLDQEMADYFEN